NKVLHDRVVILTVAIERVPHVAPDARAEVRPLGEGFYRIVLHYGFMDGIDIPVALHAIGETAGKPFKSMETSYF
ncbi:KUP/HAK/KT family potassium transporter, partial [Enterobacter hormaechei]|uniref:KUP/HAK/KT family potassium transporter n=1 Tax=Enterobacter hormaechei TaxID=158836 RepID=UPI0019541926